MTRISRILALIFIVFIKEGSEWKWLPDPKSIWYPKQVVLSDPITQAEESIEKDPPVQSSWGSLRTLDTENRYSWKDFPAAIRSEALPSTRGGQARDSDLNTAYRGVCTSRTGIFVLWRTERMVLPKKISPMRRCPCAVMAMRSHFPFAATLRISSGGSPSARWVETSRSLRRNFSATDSRYLRSVFISSDSAS